MRDSGVNVWLVNTGWSGGGFGVGERMSLKVTRALITAALENKLNEVEYVQHPIFGLNMPTSCPDVPDGVLNPRDTWTDKNAYDQKAGVLADKFNANFEQFAEYANEEILAGGPRKKARV